MGFKMSDSLLQSEAYAITANQNVYFKTQPVWQFQFHRVQYFALKFHFKFHQNF